METQRILNTISTGMHPVPTSALSGALTPTGSGHDQVSDEVHPPWLHDLLVKLGTQQGKKSFLVFKSNKYINVPTENIAFFCIRYESPMIICFDRQEYFVNYSLEQIRQLVSEKQFYRLNRQYLVNFNAVKEVEHYFARKLLVNPVIPMKEKLVVSKEKVTEFLQWLDNR